MRYAEYIGRTEEPIYIEAFNSPNLSRSRIPYCDKLLTPSEAARLIGVNVAALARWRQQRNLLSFLKWPGKGGAVRYYESDIMAICEHSNNSSIHH